MSVLQLAEQTVNQLEAVGIRGRLKWCEPMARHCTWKTGGNARLYYQPEDMADLQLFLKNTTAFPKLWLGLGSNVLIRDRGFEGIVINAVGKLNQLSIDTETRGTKVMTECGVSCAKFSRQMAAAQIAGAEFFTGIPGSMGGAMAMNAGAFGGQCWDYLEAVDTIDKHGKIRQRRADEFTVSYRSVSGLATENNWISEWFVRGYFFYPAKNAQGQGISDSSKTRGQMKQLLLERNARQPVQYANAGSVFKNPPGDHAARLIEAAGLKNYSIGDAVVSQKHANFIINRGQATAADIERLIEHIQQEVANQFAIELETEVKIYGEK